MSKNLKKLITIRQKRAKKRIGLWWESNLEHRHCLQNFTFFREKITKTTKILVKYQKKTKLVVARNRTFGSEKVFGRIRTGGRTDQKPTRNFEVAGSDLVMVQFKIFSPIVCHRTNGAITKAIPFQKILNKNEHG